MNQSQQLHMTVYASLFAALTAAGAYLAIPMGPVPIVLQNLFVLLTGLLLGSRWGLASIGIYLLAGAIGLPVFAGGTGGIARIFGPTGGYLLSYLPAVYILGIIAEKGQKTGKPFVFDLIAMICACLIVYGIGVPWLKLMTGMDWAKAFSAGMLPFLPGDGLKIAAAVPIVKTLRPVISGKFLPADTADEYY
ncbi:Biotin transporter [Desulfonema limicola]|uniref:Biotin transporter n=1 Tax=Desulfonema limicola TaxID=45656 RepID=A0A975B5M7_9BACT|nr:biotin transporter BioY [Desulfonema limicola]QTA79251.1 Biotin transporter [Desulfonema limicola]